MAANDIEYGKPTIEDVNAKAEAKVALFKVLLSSLCLSTLKIKNSPYHIHFLRQFYENFGRFRWVSFRRPFVLSPLMIESPRFAPSEAC